MTQYQSEVPFSEEDLTRVKKLVLNSLRMTLVESLDPRLFLTAFRQEYVLNARECDEIKAAAAKSVGEGAERLLDILATKGSHGFDVLCAALLEDQTQLHLLASLTSTLSQFQHNFKEFRLGQMRAAEKQHQMELTKPYTQVKCPPPRATRHLSPDYRAQHRARSPMPVEEPAPFHPAFIGHQYDHVVESHFDAFQPCQDIPYRHYQQTVPYTHYEPVLPVASLQSQQYLGVYDSVYVDSANMGIDVPCGQQGN